MQKSATIFSMKWIEYFQFFLFDFDGILVDTEPLHYAAYEKTCHQWNIPWKWSFEEYCQVAHHESQGFKKALYREFPLLLEEGPSWDLISESKKEIYIALVHSQSLQLMPGVECLLHALYDKKIPCCVVTNSLREQVEIIKKLQPVLQLIPHWITRDDCQHAKPSPEGYLLAIDRHASQEAISNKRIIGFEDTLKGFIALSQTPAYPVLICPASRSHVAECLALGGQHCASFEEFVPNQTLQTQSECVSL